MDQIRPGLFGKTVPADSRRMDFDFGNEQLLYLNKKPDILFVGDSITQLWDLHSYFETSKLIVNRGIGGDTSEYVLKRFDADVIQLHPELVVLMIGTNDIFMADDDLWWRKKGLEKEVVLEKYRENLNSMIEKCNESNIKISICSVLPSDISLPFNKETRHEMTEKMNQFLKEVCSIHHFIYIDYHTKLCQNDKKTLVYEYSDDGIHPNAKCYKIMADILQDIINI